MTDGKNYAAECAKFVTSLQYDDLPTGVVHQMKRSLLDALGAAIIGSRNDSSRTLISYIRSQPGGLQSTIFPDAVRTSSFHAALALGTYLYSTEMAESFTRAMIHCGSIITPAGLTAAERAGATGRELITAMAAGYEIAIRAGLSIRIDPDSKVFAGKDETRQGSPVKTVSPTATFGIYGAAATAAKLSGLDAARAAHALCIGSYLTPTIGLRSYDGAMTKDLSQGVSVALGVMAADLAQLGITGPTDLTLHLSAVAPDPSPEILTRDLGKIWMIESGGLHFKLRSTAAMTQSAADAVIEALATAPTGRLAPGEIKEVEVYVNHRGVRMCSQVEPPNEVAAKISIPYVVSAMLAFQNDIATDPQFIELYSDEKFNNPERRALAHKVHVLGDDDFEEGFDRRWPMEWWGRAVIHTNDGEIYSAQKDIWAHTSHLSDEEVAGKFRNVAGRVLPTDKVERVVETVFSLEDVKNINELIRSLCL